MIKVNVTKQSSYPVSAPALKKKLGEFLKKEGIVSNTEVSIALVGETKMLDLGYKYLKDRKLHNVLSFTNEEMDENFIYPPDNTIHLGEIIVCYPKVFEEARREGKLIENKVWELVEHGTRHLLGEHHEE